MVKRKCDSCGKWNEGRPKYCVHCEGYLDINEKRADQRALDQQLSKIKKQAEFESKAPFVRAIIRVGNFLEMIYISIISFIAWVVTWVAG